MFDIIQNRVSTVTVAKMQMQKKQKVNFIYKACICSHFSVLFYLNYNLIIWPKSTYVLLTQTCLINKRFYYCYCADFEIISLVESLTEVCIRLKTYNFIIHINTNFWAVYLF